jgi:predicted NBD/HSP70 family sugar kinase
MGTQKTLWGIDLGGTKAEGIILGPGGTKDIIFRDRVTTGAENGYDHVVKQIQSLVDTMEQKAGFRSPRLGIGTPGTLDPRLGTMRGCNSECLNGRSLKDDLSSLLRMDVRIANDANCFALAEATLGIVPQSYPHAEVVFGVILGTGVGGGLVVNGKIINGLHGIGGEWGHNFLDESGGPCYCGKNGCVEKVLAGPSLERYYKEVTGLSKRLAEIYELSKHGEEAAVKTMERLLNYFAKAISVVVNIVDPDVIVIGGGVGRIPEIYTAVKPIAQKYIFTTGEMQTPIVAPLLGDSAGVFGAAYLSREP